jgi:hypothetical protein
MAACRTHFPRQRVPVLAAGSRPPAPDALRRLREAGWECAPARSFHELFAAALISGVAAFDASRLAESDLAGLRILHRRGTRLFVLGTLPEWLVEAGLEDLRRLDAEEFLALTTRPPQARHADDAAGRRAE